ncbi:MAG: hypothetical protein P1S46_11185 [bacterium]|nr:hypothetical protein [bacterium]
MPKYRLSIPVLAFTALLLVLFTGQARAEASLSSVTSYTSWEEEDGTGNTAASQYVLLSNRGTLGGYRLDVEGYGRVTAVGEEVEPGDDNPNRLYTLAATLTGAQGRGSMTFGRQYIPALAGPQFLDGLNLTADFDKLSVNARWGYTADVTGDAGISKADEVLGAGLDYRLKTGMYLSLDYGRTMDDDSLLTEFIATEWAYSWYRFTRAYASFNWDLMSKTLHESLVGTRLHFSDRFSAIFELSHNVQSFDSDSIYSVFAISAAYSRTFSLLFTPSMNTRYLWDYTVENYQEGGGGRRYEVSGRWTPGRSKISASLLQHQGSGGDLVEVSTGLSTRLGDRWDVGIGWDVSRSQNKGENTVGSSLVYCGGRVKTSDSSSLDLRIERTDDDLFPESLSGRIAFELEL